jgi:glutathione S-transferase
VWANIESQSKEHLNRHPWGKIPVMVTAEGFTLYESIAICKYLARKYSLPLMPSDSDPEATALFDQAVSTMTSYFAESAGKIGFEMFAKRFIGLAPDEAIVIDARRSLEQFFDTAECLLQQSGYMAGSNFTLVDIYYIPLVQRLFDCGHGDLVTSRGAVSVWWDSCFKRPATQMVVAATKEALAAARR